MLNAANENVLMAVNTRQAAGEPATVGDVTAATRPPLSTEEVAVILPLLAADGLVTGDPSGSYQLTERGRAAADRAANRGGRQPRHRDLLHRRVRRARRPARRLRRQRRHRRVGAPADPPAGTGRHGRRRSSSRRTSPPAHRRSRLRARPLVTAALKRTLRRARLAAWRAAGGWREELAYQRALDDVYDATLRDGDPGGRVIRGWIAERRREIAGAPAPAEIRNARPAPPA